MEKDKSRSDNSSFAEMYDNICNEIRQSGTLDTIMTQFQDLKNDMERVTFARQLKNMKFPSTKLVINSKNFEESKRLESSYDELIQKDYSQRKALKTISASLRLTPLTDRSAIAVRYMKRGWCLLLLEEFDSAYKDASRSLLYDNCRQNAWNSFEILGHCLAKRGEFKLAKINFTEALSGLRESRISNEKKAKGAQRICIVFKNIDGRKDQKVKKKVIMTNTKECLPTPTGGCHNTMVSASAKTDVFKSKNRGRGLIAIKDIFPGDVIIAETAFAAILSPQQQDTHCVECFSRNPAPVPCDTCSLVWFCSEECKELNKDGAHHYECPILSKLQDDSLGKIAHLVFRILLNRGWKRLNKERKSLLELTTAEKQPTIFPENVDKVQHIWQQKYSSSDYHTIFHLVTNEDKRPFGDYFKRSISAVYLTHCLEMVNFFPGKFTEADFIFVAGQALRHLQACSCNAYELQEYITNPICSFPGTIIELGGAVYPTISLTNHSCWPNTTRYSVGKSCVLRATRYIPKNSEVFDNYGFYFYVDSLSRRKEVLNSQYMFDCDCLACSSKWPLYANDDKFLVFKCPVTSCSRHLLYSGTKSTQCSKCGNVDVYIKVVKEIQKQLESFKKVKQLLRGDQYKQALPLLLQHQHFLDHHAVAPCKHFTEVQLALKHCFYVVGNTHKEKTELVSVY